MGGGTDRDGRTPRLDICGGFQRRPWHRDLHRQVQSGTQVMVIGYVVPVVLLVAVCAVAVAPPRPSESGRSHWTYTCGAFLANELPFVVLFWFALWTVQAAASGDIGQPLGIAGVALTTIGVALVIVIASRGFLARRDVERAITRDLGALSSAEVSLPNTGDRRRRRHSWLRIVLMPLSFRGRHVHRVANVTYGPSGRRNLLDLYHHRSKRGGPILVYFHGGGFRSGHKNREAKLLLHRFARGGWVAVSANYRLAPDASIDDAIDDAKRALRWVRDNGEAYGGDGAHIYVAGSSAGAYLAATCALTADPSVESAQEGATDVVVDGAICLYGFYGTLGEPITSTRHRNNSTSTPPMFIAHGDLDTLVLVEDARAFVTATRSASNGPVVYAELRGAHHGFDIFRSARFEAVADGIDTFIEITKPNGPHSEN